MGGWENITHNRADKTQWFYINSHDCIYRIPKEHQIFMLLSMVHLYINPSTTNRHRKPPFCNEGVNKSKKSNPAPKYINNKSENIFTSGLAMNHCNMYPLDCGM